MFFINKHNVVYSIACVHTKSRTSAKPQLFSVSLSNTNTSPNDATITNFTGGAWAIAAFRCGTLDMKSLHSGSKHTEERFFSSGVVCVKHCDPLRFWASPSIPFGPITRRRNMAESAASNCEGTQQCSSPNRCCIGA